ncbi:hypothetical protein PILCRDRAFT_820674 [Piloderma croceum F 1598]|uniref:Actin cortical patch SUR7/pH-response regulator PalI n=1 Tax=Piloderma croceum (strain F 1598) TaxID=765440 RepID=A0A0C3FTU7_PILCF|nr:hypothetical protein PILCRDRAFT_820674 [Piloderma croceum F 1598]
MATVNVSGPGESASLFTNTSSVPLQEHVGLRQFYDFGLYSYCAYVDVTAGSCSHTKAATEFLPYDMISADVAVGHLSSATPDTIVLSASIGSQSRSAYYLILLGSICTALAFFAGVVKRVMAFFYSSLFAILGSIFLLSGAAVWTAIIKNAQGLSHLDITLENTSVQLSLQLAAGRGLFLTWAAYVCLSISIVPYMLICFTFRG